MQQNPIDYIHKYNKTHIIYANIIKPIILYM